MNPATTPRMSFPNGKLLEDAGGVAGAVIGWRSLDRGIYQHCGDGTRKGAPAFRARGSLRRPPLSLPAG